jgi:hypothetical protein
VSSITLTVIHCRSSECSFSEISGVCSFTSSFRVGHITMSSNRFYTSSLASQNAQGASKSSRDLCGALESASLSNTTMNCKLHFQASQGSIIFGVADSISSDNQIKHALWRRSIQYENAVPNYDELELWNWCLPF